MLVCISRLAVVAWRASLTDKKGKYHGVKTGWQAQHNRTRIPCMGHPGIFPEIERTGSVLVRTCRCSSGGVFLNSISLVAVVTGDATYQANDSALSFPVEHHYQRGGEYSCLKLECTVFGSRGPKLQRHLLAGTAVGLTGELTATAPKAKVKVTRIKLLWRTLHRFSLGGPGARRRSPESCEPTHQRVAEARRRDVVAVGL